MHGFGVYAWKDGRCYKGEWEQGVMHGCGSLTSKRDPEALPQEGQFVSSQFVGPGLACPVDTARFAAKEAEDFGRKAQRFELQD